jgi:hypothetical protein
MRNVLTSAVVALGMAVVSWPAFAGGSQAVPEPVSLSLLAGGIVAIAAVKRLRHK